jgi:hypothetical protein
MYLPHARRGGVLLAAAVVVASLFAGCGAAATPSPTPVQDPSALLGTSLATTAKLTGPIDVTLSLDGKMAQSDGTTSDVSGSTVVATIDRAAAQGELILDLKGVQGATDIKADVRVVNGTAYVQADLLGATWYSLPLSAAEALIPSAVPMPSAIPSFDPGTVLAPLLKDPGVKITSNGVQQLDGRDQDVVTVTLSAASIAAWAAQAESLAGTSGVALPSIAPNIPDIPVTVWIDRQTQQLSKISTSITDSGSSLTVALTIKAHSGSVSVQAPPADQTQDASQLLQMFMGSGSGGANPFGNLFGSPAP